MLLKLVSAPELLVAVGTTVGLVASAMYGFLCPLRPSPRGYVFSHSSHLKGLSFSTVGTLGCPRTFLLPHLRVREIGTLSLAVESLFPLALEVTLFVSTNTKVFSFSTDISLSSLSLFSTRSALPVAGDIISAPSIINIFATGSSLTSALVS